MLDFRQILTVHAPDIAATTIHKPDVYFEIQDGGRHHIGFSKNHCISDKYGRILMKLDWQVQDITSEWANTKPEVEIDIQDGGVRHIEFR